MTTQAPIDPRHEQGQQKVPRVEVYWRAVTYKTVVGYSCLGVAILFGGFYLAKPDWYSFVYKKFTNAVNNAVSNSDPELAGTDQKKAKFVNLDGKVEVKKVDSVKWADADFRTSLDKGDQIKTGPDGDARITFADGTTPTWTLAESKAQVRVEDTKAQLGSNSRGAVKADPENKSSEIVVSSGSAQVQRGAEKIDLAAFEKVTIPSGGAIQKSNVLAPPDLLEPLNLAPIIVENPKTSPVRFEWKPVQDAVSYTLRVSTTAMFTKTVKDATVHGTAVEITGFDPGEYFWNVKATDGKKSAIFKFTLVARGQSQDMVLEIISTQVVGHSAEIVGKTEPGAALIVNGQSVPNIAPDGNFRHFTEQLAPGQHTISIIGSNRRGGTNMKQVSIVVPK